jgi:hypothetical protein
VTHAEKVRDYYRRQGEKTERERIVALLERTPFLWVGDKQLIQLGREELIAEIKKGREE